jgi:hypothetical protein
MSNTENGDAEMAGWVIVKLNSEALEARKQQKKAEKLVSSFTYSSTLKMEAVCSPKRRWICINI